MFSANYYNNPAAAAANNNNNNNSHSNIAQASAINPFSLTSDAPVDLSSLSLLSYDDAIAHSKSPLSITPDQDLLYLWLKCCRENDLSRLKQLIQLGYNFNAVDSDGDTGLHRSAAGGHTDIAAELLLTTGININAQNKAGNTALHISIFNNQPNINFIRLLLNCGAAVDIKNCAGATVLSHLQAPSSSNSNNYGQASSNSEFISFFGVQIEKNTNFHQNNTNAQLFGEILQLSQSVHRHIIIRKQAELTNLHGNNDEIRAKLAETMENNSKFQQQLQGQSLELLQLRADKATMNSAAHRLVELHQQLQELKENQRVETLPIEQMRGAIEFLMHSMQIQPKILITNNYGANTKNSNSTNDYDFLNGQTSNQSTIVRSARSNNINITSAPSSPDPNPNSYFGQSSTDPSNQQLITAPRAHNSPS
jgi:ankyrin repeat protein